MLLSFGCLWGKHPPKNKAHTYMGRGRTKSRAANAPGSQICCPDQQKSRRRGELLSGRPQEGPLYLLPQAIARVCHILFSFSPHPRRCACARPLCGFGLGGRTRRLDHAMRPPGLSSFFKRPAPRRASSNNKEEGRGQADGAAAAAVAPLSNKTRRQPIVGDAWWQVGRVQASSSGSSSGHRVAEQQQRPTRRRRKNTQVWGGGPIDPFGRADAAGRLTSPRRHQGGLRACATAVAWGGGGGGRPCGSGVLVGSSSSFRLRWVDTAGAAAAATTLPFCGGSAPKAPQQQEGAQDGRGPIAFIWGRKARSPSFRLFAEGGGLATNPPPIVLKQLGACIPCRCALHSYTHAHTHTIQNSQQATTIDTATSSSSSRAARARARAVLLLLEMATPQTATQPKGTFACFPFKFLFGNQDGKDLAAKVILSDFCLS